MIINLQSSEEFKKFFIKIFFQLKEFQANLKYGKINFSVYEFFSLEESFLVKVSKGNF